MLIRITQNSAGIEHYFETGAKKGRVHTRDSLDERVHLMGNLDAFSTAVAYTNKHKSWKQHYWHITASFALENNDLDTETLRDITRDMLEYYFTGYQLDDLFYAAEAHQPKMQSELNQSTQQQEQRLLHLHIAASKLDKLTDNQIRMIPFNLTVDRAFQSHLAKKYGLVDPADRKRKKTFTKADMVSRWNARQKPASAQTKVAELRAQFSELLSKVTTLREAIELLKASELVAKIEYKQQKSGNRYLQIKTTLGTHNINLRGKGFELLERFYYTPAELAINREKKQSKNIAAEDTQESYQAIYERYQQWWIAQEKKRKKPKIIKHEATQKKYEKKFTERLKEAKIYYVLYQNNIEEQLIHGYQIWEKNNTRYLFNNDLGVKIYDRPNKITLQMPGDPKKRRNAIALMLAMAQAKGWDMNTLKANGSDLFKQEVQRQIRKFNREPKQLSAEEQKLIAKPSTPEAQAKAKLNAIDQAINDNQQKKAKKLSKEQIAKIKTDLDAQQVINYAVQQLGLIETHFSVTEDNKIADDRLKSKPRNVIDFLTKTCNMKFTEVMPLLEQMHEDQQEREESYMGY
ncbi:MAG: hypothetical protein methR_P0589 [Methyloprofundus sp.]|nr:MAG: hypothetical protein methR_P0589 [Methyloprofundus sp.]